jgi:hypothetical protein
MRPVFVIYLAAGLTLFFAVLNSAAYVGNAYVTHYAIVSLNPEGDDLGRMLAVQDHDLELAAEVFSLALLQAGIIFSARKLSTQVMLANNSPEPATDNNIRPASRFTP